MPGVSSAEMSVPTALTIAGSDSSGGAGIQADLRTFAFHCVHGASAITCVTAQNTLGVNRVDALPAEAVLAQIDAVIDDLHPQVAKTGMLLNAEIAAAVAAKVGTADFTALVVDPVMVSRSGDRLLDDAAISIIVEQLIPQATMLTPNRFEAEILSGFPVTTLAEMQAAAEAIYKFGSQVVLVKGGGMQGSLQGVDVWFDGQRLEVLETQRVETAHTHGTGCTLSAAIAANLAKGQDPLTATRRAKDYVTQALGHALKIGAGQGPVGHFFPLLPAQTTRESASAMPNGS